MLYGETPSAMIGQLYGSHAITETVTAAEKIYPGDPIFGLVGDDKMGYLAHLNAVTLTGSANLITGNQVAIVINGIDVGSVAFQTDHATTMVAIVNAIDQNEAVRALGIDAFQVEGVPRAIYLGAPGVSITAALTVTGGSSQASFSSSAGTSSKFIGIAKRSDALSFKDGVGFYPPSMPVGVLKEGRIAIRLADATVPGDKKPAYIILDGNDAGKFTDDDSGNYDSGCIFRSDRIDGDLAFVEVHGIK
jgi:hypothetical protein